MVAMNCKFYRLIQGLVVAMVVLLQSCAVDPTIGLDGGVEDGSPAVSPQDEYLLRAGDQIAIQVFNDDELTMEAKVSQSGSINYSYVGTIAVAGLTADQLAESITEKLRGDYLKNPAVNVTVQQYRAFFVDGEVRRPGSYDFEPGLTLAKALSLAGGMTDRGSQSRIILAREVEGERKNYRGDLSQRIQPGDVITVGERVF